MLREYTGVQNPKNNLWRKEIEQSHRLWLVFTAVRDGFQSLLTAVYEYSGDGHVAERGDLPGSYPEDCVTYGENLFFPLKDADSLGEYRERLIVDWPYGVSMTMPCDAKPAPVLGIVDPETVMFPGFDEIHLKRGKLKDMYANPYRYEPWHVAMAAVQAVYVIACTDCGSLYVGSATGRENLWQRWGDYAASPDGSADNTGLARHIAEHPEHLSSFQYSVLQTFAPTTDPELVLAVENRFKKCLDSMKHGMNDN